MRSPLMLLLLVACAALGAWLLLSQDEAPAEQEQVLEPDPLVVDDEPVPEALVLPLPVVVVEEQPAGLLDFVAEEGEDPLQKIELRLKRITFPKTLKKVTGEHVLRVFASVLGPQTKFYFVGKDQLEKYKGLEFPLDLRTWHPFESMVAMSQGLGFEPKFQDGKLWFLALDGRPDQPPDDPKD